MAPMEGVEGDESEMNLNAYYFGSASQSSLSDLSDTALQLHGISPLPQQLPQDPTYLASQSGLSQEALQAHGIPPYLRPSPQYPQRYPSSQIVHGTMGGYHAQHLPETESRLGWIDVTTADNQSMSTPMPRQWPLPLSTSSASSVTTAIINASPNFPQRETQSEKMDEDDNELGPPQVRSR